MKLEDGGLAFPCSQAGMDGIQQPHSEDGMTLRQWYAGQALARLAATAAHIDDIAKACYQLADAMIAEGENDHD